MKSTDDSVLARKRECFRKWYDANRTRQQARSLTRMKELYIKDPEKYRQRAKDWARAHKDLIAERDRKRYAREKEARIARAAQWKKDNPFSVKQCDQKRRAILQGAAGYNYTTAEHIKARFEMWGGMCYMCGKPANSVDHVIPISKGGAHFPANLRPACISCNSSKGART